MKDVGGTDLSGTPSPVEGPLVALDAVLGSAAIGVAVFDVDGRYLYVNEAAATYTGISPAAHVGRTVGEVAPAAAAMLDPLIARAADGEAISDVEVVGADVHGRVRTSIGALIPYKGDHGEVAAVVALFWELTERIEAEAEQRAIDDHFRQLADAAPVLMWTMDTDGRCDWLSGGWSQYVGIPVEEQLGGGWLASVHPDDREPAMARMRAAFAAREPFDVELRVRRADGAHRWLLDRGVPRADAEGEFAGYVGTCTDIHERRLAQDRTEALQRVTAALAQAVGSDDVVDAVAEHVVEAVGADAGSLCLLRADGSVWVERAVGYAEPVLGRFASFPLEADLPIAHAIRTGEPVLIEDVEELPPGPWRDLWRGTAGGTAAAAALPLVAHGSVVGALGLSFGSRRDLDERERDFLLAVAAQCAGAIERAALYDAEQEARRASERSQDRLAFLAEAGRLLAGALSREEILQRVADLAVAHLAPWVSLHLEEDGLLRRAVLAHRIDGDVADRLAPESVPAVSELGIAQCYRSGRALVLDPLDLDRTRRVAPGVAAAAEEAHLASVVLAPLRARSSILGVLSLCRFEGSPPLVDRDVDVVVELASRAGLAVESADLYEQEHRAAETLQRAVLPSRLPELPGVEVAARYLPSSAGVRVGGDWYDAFDLRDGRVGIVIGDVAGHGLRAAAVMGQLRNALRAYAVDGDPPNLVLNRLSRLLHEEREAPFATAIYGVYEAATGRLVLANAGHPPPLRRSGEAIHPVGAATAPPLGVMGSPPEDDVEVVLEVGDLLLLYTDGLVERRTEHLDAGVARLVRTLGGQPADRAVGDVCEAVVAGALRGTVQEDDVCVLALRRSS